MQKAVLILSGNPSGKNEFDRIAKETCWVWHCNSRNHLGKISKSFFWNGERDEKYEKYISEIFPILNDYFDFEENYFKDLLNNKFLPDSDDVKTSEDGKEFRKFLFVIHGLSKSLVQVFEEEYGAFQIHISSRSLNSNVENHDVVLYEDDPDFREQVENLIDTLVK